ncbi:hypothetical protein [Leifsonia poae]|uniref:hypothetical protein n=1 Tax=Leifsonia poae TaxID=110933 RepID=UPI001CBAEA10|nr:hypothetical protein [Leifsonia poae]
MRARGYRLGALVGGLGLIATMSTMGVGAANATPAPSAPPADKSCWIAIDTGDSLCVPAGDDLVAAVAEQKGVRLVIPDGTVLGGVAVNSARSDLAPAAALASVALSAIYDDVNYGGSSYVMSVSGGNCSVSAYGLTDLNGIGWYGRVSSYKSFGTCKTALFKNTNYGGTSTGYAVNAASLGSMNDQAKSWRVSG